MCIGWLCARRYPKAVELLLSKGADTGVHLSDGATLFTCAEELQIQDTLALKMAEVGIIVIGPMVQWSIGPMAFGRPIVWPIGDLAASRVRQLYTCYAILPMEEFRV